MLLQWITFVSSTKVSAAAPLKPTEPRLNEHIISHDGPGHLWLASLQNRGVVLGLERVTALCRRLGDPQTKLRPVLVAGTNGKGSTTAMLGALLGAAGMNVGVYISPHLFETRERIRIGDACVTAQALDDALVRVQGAADTVSGDSTADPSLLLPTPFEALTAAAFLLFAEAKVDVVVLEVGLGGRLDATNIVDPWVSIVTRIGHDHQAILGQSLAAIAEQKVAIGRTGRPLIVAQAAVTLGAARRIGLEADVRKVGVDLRIVDAAVSGKTLRTTGVLEGKAVGEPLHVELALAGLHQLENAAAAVLGYVALDEQLRQRGLPALPPPVEVVWALGSVDWPARAEILAERPLVVLDGAHNPDGVAALVELLSARGNRWQTVLSMRSNRDPEEVIRALAPITETFFLPRLVGPTLRPARALADEIERIAPQAAVAVGPPAACLQAAVSEASPLGGVVVTGSLHGVGEWLGSGLLESARLTRWLG